MKKSEYLRTAVEAYSEGRISAEAYDAALMNIDVFVDEDDEDYSTSSTNGDYSPSNPWDAPGMTVEDFL